MRDSETEAIWLAEHPEEEHRYAGEWILVEGRRIIAHDADLGHVHDVAESHPQALLAQALGEEGLIPIQIGSHRFHLRLGWAFSDGAPPLLGRLDLFRQADIIFQGAADMITLLPPSLVAR